MWASSAPSPGTAPPCRVSVTSVSLGAAREAGRSVDYLLERPRAVLGTLASAQIAAAVVLAFSIPHNGWVWFQGGDQIWLATQGWLLGHLELPPTEVGYLWSLLLTPIMTSSETDSYAARSRPIVRAERATEVGMSPDVVKS